MESLLSAPVTLSLIAANLIASIYAFYDRNFLDQNSFWVEGVRGRKQYHRVLTSGFLHVALWHVGLNMMVLSSFGPALEGALGPIKFAILYFASLVGGSLWMLVEKAKVPAYRAIGASGAISGLLVCFGLLQPFAMVSFFFLIPMYAIVAVLVFIGVDVLLSRSGRDLWAHGGHLGGALGGFLVMLLLEPGALGELLRQTAEKIGS